MPRLNLAMLVAALMTATGAPMASAAPEPEPRPDQRYGMVTGDPENVRASEPTAVTDATSLAAPQPGAEVFGRPADGVYDIIGGGYGHRIGMSQYGAQGAAEQGLDHTEILAFYYPGTNLEPTDRTVIRVGITVDKDGITRVAHRAGLTVSAGPGATAYPLPADRTEWRVRASSTSPTSCVLEGKAGSTWTPYWPAGMPRSCPVTFASPTEGTVDLYLPDGSQRVYRGQLTATHRGTTNLLTFNRLPVQHYLYSVVPAELSTSFHTEALRSQAVAARTYALGGSSGNSHYDTCDTTYCQVYRGMGTRTSTGAISPYEFTKTTDAVRATDKEVLTYVFADGRKRLATTMFSSSSGGHTDNGGAGHGYLVDKPDPYDDTASNVRHSWEAQLPVTSLESRYGIHRVERVQVLSRDGDGTWGGRILTARVEGFTASGDYTYAAASGMGLMLARYWPTYRAGLSSDYFTFLAEAAAPAPEPALERVAGNDRYGTAAEISQEWAPDVSVAYVVDGTNFPDALSASARAGVYDAPVLLTTPTSLPSATRAALTRLSPSRIVVLGGPGSVSGTQLEELKGYADTRTVERVAGSDRYETAAAVASHYPRGVDRVFLVSGQSYADAMSGAARAAHEEVPLLLTRQDRLDTSTLTQLARLDPREVVVLGGTSAVSDAVAQQAATYSTSGTFRRLAGNDRYYTAAAVAGLYPSGVDTAYVATGQKFPDALVVAALAGRRGEPLVLTRGDVVSGGADMALRHVAPQSITVLGGASSISDAVFDKLATYLQ